MERTTFSEINLDAPDKTPRSCVSYGISLNQFGNSVSLGARLVHGLRITIGLETIMEAPDDNPR